MSATARIALTAIRRCSTALKVASSLTANAACSGATTSEVADDDDQLSALDRDTRLVTLTVGAANLGLSGVLAACTNPELRTLAKTEIDRRPTCVGGLSGRRESARRRSHRAVCRSGRCGAGARIVVTGYPLSV